ncbi:MAG: type II toxin-antitoxin system VapC family toxin [Candidatus Anammoxibacter sp.]
MKFLLDTHTFLWFINGSPKLNNYSRHLIEEQANRRFLNVASLWEMSIKISIGKLTLPMSIPKLVVDQV